MALSDDPRVPVTVVTGYLGAGKSTLLNHLIRENRNKRFAVVVNEFGDIGIDGELIETGDEELIELTSGCLCCVVRGDLIRALRGLLKRNSDLDGILVETTGVANPGPVIQTFAADQILAGRARLDAVVTVADAVHIAEQIAASEDAADQAALASVIVLNKVSDAKNADAAEAAIRALNPHAAFHRADRARVDVETVLGVGGFSLDRIATELENDHDPDHDHVAASGIASVSFEQDGALDAAALEAWLERLLMLRGADILRLKGVLDVAGEDRRIIVQSVHMMHEVDRGAPWAGARRRSKLVVIGRNLDPDEIRNGLSACRAVVPA